MGRLSLRMREVKSGAVWLVKIQNVLQNSTHAHSAIVDRPIIASFIIRFNQVNTQIETTRSLFNTRSASRVEMANTDTNNVEIMRKNMYLFMPT